MGIRNLYKKIKVGRPRLIREFTGMCVSVDVSIIIHSSFHMGGSITHNGESVGHLRILLQKHQALIRHGIIPIYVFDNVAPIEKRKELDKREASNRVVIPSEVYVSTLMFIKLLGAKYIISPPTRNNGREGVDAEHVCAQLYLDGVTRYALTDDSDTLVYGSPILRTFRGAYTSIDIDDILNYLGIDQPTFVEICVLSGTDFNAKEPDRNAAGKVGPRYKYFTPGVAMQPVVKRHIYSIITSDPEMLASLQVFVATVTYTIESETFDERTLRLFLLERGISENLSNIRDACR